MKTPRYTPYVERDEFADPQRYPDGIAWRSGVVDERGHEIDGEGDIATYEEAKRLALDTVARLLDREFPRQSTPQNDRPITSVDEERATKAFPITSVARQDLEDAGYDTSEITDDDMQNLAGDMADAYVEHSFWQDIGIIADNLKFKKR